MTRTRRRFYYGAALFLCCLLSTGSFAQAPVVYLNGGRPLVGMSGEYLPHVPIPTTSKRYSNTCTLATHVECFAAMAGLNKTQLWLSLDSSPGFDDHLNMPYTDEQPFFWDGAKWNVNRPDPNFLPNVNTVITDARNSGLTVEVTLFDQWNGNFAHSPWNPNNTRFAIGFTSPLFLTSYNTTSGQGKDPAGSQDATARTSQMNFVTDAVQQLAGNSNIIWQIANEPDSVLVNPTTLNISQAAYIQNLLHWHQDVAAAILTADPNHPISVNLTTQAAIDAFASAINTGQLKGVTMINGHYVRRVGNLLGTAYGAPEIIENYGNPPKGPLPVAFGFNESRSTPNPVIVGARAEAWEMMAAGAGSYDNYTFGLGQQIEPGTQNLSASMKAVISYLTNLLSFFQPLNLTSVTRDNNQPGKSPSWATATPPIAYGNNDVYWGALHWNRQYALYVHHSCITSPNQPGGTFNNLRYKPVCSNYQNTFTLTLNAVPQNFNVEWFTPDSSQPICTQVINWQGSPISVTSPAYTYDVGLRVRHCTVGVDCVGTTSCSNVQGPACPLNTFPDEAVCLP